MSEIYNCNINIDTFLVICISVTAIFLTVVVYKASLVTFDQILKSMKR